MKTTINPNNPTTRRDSPCDCPGERFPLPSLLGPPSDKNRLFRFIFEDGLGVESEPEEVDVTPVLIYEAQFRLFSDAVEGGAEAQYQATSTASPASSNTPVSAFSPDRRKRPTSPPARARHRRYPARFRRHLAGMSAAQELHDANDGVCLAAPPMHEIDARAISANRVRTVRYGLRM